MHFTLLVEAELERVSGKFASREDLVTELLEALEGVDPGSVWIDESEYEVTDWTVSEQEQPKRPRRSAAR